MGNLPKYGHPYSKFAGTDIMARYPSFTRRDDVRSGSF
jgi:hypothetical protein